MQVVEWDRTHRCCGACAAPTQRNSHELSKVCPSCGLTVYSRVAPAMMVRIKLLARSPHFAPGVSSALASFVEPSKTLEDACRREGREEVSVEIGNLRSFASQPWPFPHSRMIAFTADSLGSEIVPQPDEIEDARWYPVTALPGLPAPFRLSRQLIDAVAGRK